MGDEGRCSTQPLQGRFGELGPQQEGGFTLDGLQKPLGLPMIGGNRHDGHGRALPQILVVNLRHRHVKFGPQAVL